MKFYTGNFIILAFFLSGMAALIYEVVWFRPLQLIFGSSIFAISTMLTTFLSGFVVGSYFFRELADKSKNPLFLFAILEFGIGIYGIIIIFLFSLLPAVYIPVYKILPPQIFLIVQFISIFAVLIIPTTLIGATWPVVNRAYVRSTNSVGKETGVLYSFNSFGAGVGSILAGFLLIPTLGISGTVLLAAALNLIASSFVFRISGKI